jgi:hypothetical protein
MTRAKPAQRPQVVHGILKRPQLFRCFALDIECLRGSDQLVNFLIAYNLIGPAPFGRQCGSRIDKLLPNLR